jgi:methylated-DNA-[protein]-cysteine S-methyltransferase
VNKVYVHSFKTGIGTIRTVATENGLAMVSLPGEPRQRFDDRMASLFGPFETASGGAINNQAEKELKAYLEGQLTKFTVKLDVQGSPFQKRVLDHVSNIPYGRTVTYGEIACATGNPKASRAVGAANAKNHLPLVIPCHRVVASTGLGGYGGGVDLKKRLLRMEGAL